MSTPITLLRPAVSLAVAGAITATLAADGFAAQMRIAPNILWPTDAEFATTTDLATFGSNDKLDRTPPTISQTFKVDAEFDAQSLFVRYRNKEAETNTARLQIIEIADRFADPLPENPAPADIIYDQVFTGLSTLLPGGNVNGETVVAQILLDERVTLSPTTGAAGYEVRFTGISPNTNEFRLSRRGGGNDAEGEFYTDGNGYRALTPRGFQRDYAIAFSSVVPEPASVALLGLLAPFSSRRRR